MPPPPPSTAVPSGDPTKVMGRRIGAAIIDVVIGWLIFFAMLLSLGDSIDEDGFCDPDDSPIVCIEINDTAYYGEDDGLGATILAAMIGGWFFMGIIIQGATGGTPGKLAMGLRVVDRHTGQRVGYAKAAARTALWVVDAIPFVFPLVGLIVASASNGHRRVGDIVADTLVVPAAAVGTPPVVPGLTTAGTGPPALTPPGAWPDHAPPPSVAAPPLGVSPPTAATPPPPPPSAPLPAPPPPSATSGDGIDAPMWDPARRAYLQWDKAQQRWMRYDDAEATWKPLT